MKDLKNRNPRVAVGLDGRPGVWEKFRKCCDYYDTKPSEVLRNCILHYISASPDCIKNSSTNKQTKKTK